MAKFARTVGPFTKDEAEEIADQAFEGTDLYNSFIKYLTGDIESANLANELDCIFECAWDNVQNPDPDSLDDIYGEVT